MKPTGRRLKLIKFCKDTLDIFETSDDINSSSHYNDIIRSINTNLDEYPNRVKDGIYEGLTDLLNVIKKL